MNDEELLKQSEMMLLQAVEADSVDIYDKALMMSLAASQLVIARNSRRDIIGLGNVKPEPKGQNNAQ